MRCTETGRENFDEQRDYVFGFSVNDLFTINSVGVVTSKDSILINASKEVLIEKVEKYYNIEFKDDCIKRVYYRPFDYKFIYYDTTIIERSREKIMFQLCHNNNIGLMTTKKIEIGEFAHISCFKNIVESHAVSMKEINYAFPLYIYPNNNTQQTIDQSNVRKPNLNTEIVNQIATKLGLTFTTEKETTIGTFAPIDILDYIYAVLHSPTYREKYKEFLKIDFPRVPYPKEMTSFKKMSSLGSQLREIHLLESPIVSTYITQYPIDGNNVVTKPHFIFLEASNPNPTHGRVYINDSQYFSGVPQVAWKFYIGGYQPAQKWLKDRKERTLEFDDILHYQKIIVALTETDRLMKEIDTLNLGIF